MDGVAPPASGTPRLRVCRRRRRDHRPGRAACRRRGLRHAELGGPRLRTVVVKRVALVALLLVGPGSVLAQERTIPEKLAAPARATLQRLIDSAGVAGLPVDPLYSKAQEGV